jgi:hypothetical protein
VQPQTPSTDWQADFDPIDDHDEAPQSTLTTWLLGLLFALVIGWLPAATETPSTPPVAPQGTHHHHLVPTTDRPACTVSGQEVNPLAQACLGHSRTNVLMSAETVSPRRER